jgi:hypothetical protein
MAGIPATKIEEPSAEALYRLRRLRSLRSDIFGYHIGFSQPSAFRGLG